MQSEDKIYIRDDFPAEFIAAFNKYGVIRPVLNQLYTFRAVIKTTQGIGVLLNEIINEETPIIHPFGRIEGKAEVSWNINRFRNLDGSVITDEEVRETKEELKGKKEVIIVRPIRKDEIYENN